MNRVLQPLTLAVLGLNAGMGTAAGADELVLGRVVACPSKTNVLRQPVCVMS